MSPIPCCLHPSLGFWRHFLKIRPACFLLQLKGWDMMGSQGWSGYAAKNGDVLKGLKPMVIWWLAPHEVKLQPCRGSWPICRSYRRERVEHPEATEYMKWRAKWCKMSWYWKALTIFWELTVQSLGQMGWPIEFKVDLATVSGRGDIPITMRSWESPCLYPRYS